MKFIAFVAILFLFLYLVISTGGTIIYYEGHSIAPTSLSTIFQTSLDSLEQVSYASTVIDPDARSSKQAFVGSETEL